jgi:RNA polymerase sigma-70 factor (ECF subfamily)
MSPSRKGSGDGDAAVFQASFGDPSRVEGTLALPGTGDRSGEASEQALVKAAQAGDEQALETLYRAHYDVVYRYVLYRVGVVTVAEDVTSQVFLGMVRNLPGFRWRGKPFIAWLYAIAQKQIAFHLRTVSRRGEAVDLDAVGDLVADATTPHASAVERERRTSLVRALGRLPDTQREVVLLRFVLSLSLAETAASLGKSEGAVKQLQLRGLSAMREILGS